MEAEYRISEEYAEYFSNLLSSLEEIYEIAKKARLRGPDPRPYPEIELASDLASLVEGFIGLPGLAERIRALSKTMSRERAAFNIAKEIVCGKFGQLSDEKAADLAIRTALAILTEGVTAAVYSEGIAKVAIKNNPDGSRYLAVYFAGPIRSAGGTEAALTPVIADVVRQLLKLDRYKPTREEIERFIEELRLYEREVGRFQYSVSDEQLRFALEHLPVEVTGTPSDPVEVASYRNLPRIETNRVRGGALRVVNDGIVGRASKVLAVVEDLGIKGWEWLKEIKEIAKEKGKSLASFMEEVPAGRPILCFPSRKGGFRLRYGRSRNTGLSAVGVHPLTMIVLQNFLAGGTQLKIEAPGKSSTVMPVDYIETPIVRLKDGSVVKVSYENIELVKREAEKILFLGDILISFGDFLYNNKPLLPPGYCEEFWREDLRRAIIEDFNGNIEEAASRVGLPSSSLKSYLDDPFNNKPSINEAITLSRTLKIPLHPLYTYFWFSIPVKTLKNIRRWLLNSNIKFDGELVVEVRGSYDAEVKEALEEICIPHRVIGKCIVIEGYDAHSFAVSLGLNNPSAEISENLSILENLSRLSGLIFRDKAGAFIGARVGRPEKAKEREMKPPVHVLFPVGLSGGAQRDLMKAYGKGMVKVEIISRICPKCQTITFKRICSNCGTETSLRFICPRCGRDLDREDCPICKIEARSFCHQIISIRDLVDEACRKIGYRPEQVKGVRGLTNKTRVPEPIEKGILRAKYGLSVYKDGTIRFDATNAPLTHFKPSEIGVSLEKLRELGYTHDYLNNPLTDLEQICELKVQDIIIPWKCAEYLVSVAKFIDELLEKVYGLPPFYKIDKPQDLIGHLIVGLAPHTCAGVLGRIIGFTKLNVCFAHPFWHSAKRRDCDGDEDSIMLALDAFLNFSREYLPDQIGGIMDSPLFIIRAVMPEDVQRQAHEFDVADKYPLEFYEEAGRCRPARELLPLIDIVKHRFNSELKLQGFMFTVPTSNIEAGNKESIYKTLKRMSDKLNAQLGLAEKIKAVDAHIVAEIVLNTHFIRDISGNLRAFATQSFRCKKCNKRFRRVPLKGVCLECGGELTLTVHRGTIEKYLEDAWRLVRKYGMSEYYTQRLTLIEEEINSLFEGSRGVKQSDLSKWLPDES
ncbi:MAG: DNA polymerase II large subunit [Candidatus Bathyarchaeia archaeon]|nr:DNA polymerase II large subunit [Candidatus Bathyarchaeota archaeon]